MSAWPESIAEVESLRSAWQRGDWDTLIPRLLAIGAHCLRGSALSDDERDDVLSRALVRAWAQRDVPDHPAAWTFRVCRNLVLDDAKHARFVVGEPSLFHADHAPLPDDLVIDRLTTQQVHERLRAALQSLPDHFRRCVVLRHMHGRSYDEIAAQLQVPASTVRGRIAIGLRKLRAWYAPDAVTHPSYLDLHTHAQRDAAGMT